MTGSVTGAALPENAAGLKLHRIGANERLMACEAVLFPGGRAAVDTVLRRAAVSGRVEIGGDIKRHFADVLDSSGSMIETIALDAESYRMLKTKWMPCLLEQS